MITLVGEDTKRKLFVELVPERVIRIQYIQKVYNKFVVQTFYMRVLLFLFFWPLASSAQEAKSFTLKGLVPAAKHVDWVYLTYRNGEEVVRDSAKATKGEFL